MKGAHADRYLRAVVRLRGRCERCRRQCVIACGGVLRARGRRRAGAMVAPTPGARMAKKWPKSLIQVLNLTYFTVDRLGLVH